MNFWRDHRGAVSVFIIIVLVPCIAISCIFVDLSRVQLSKTMANSSADLALNTLLTNYDAELSEYYGLIGSCQNIEDFYKKSAEFFLRTIKSQDLADSEIFLLSDVYASVTGDDTIYDLLQVECDGATVSAVEGANMGNPAILKDAIVEFMKYRAPIEMTTTLVGRIQSGVGGVSEFLDSDENKPLVEAKQDFYKAEGELLEAAIYTYVAIENYEKQFNDPAPYGVSHMKVTEDKITKYKKAYEQIHAVAVNNLLNTDKLGTPYHRWQESLSTYKNRYKDDTTALAGICSSTEEAEDGSTIYYINGKDFQNLMNEASNALGALNNAVNNYSAATRTLMQSNPYNSANAGINKVQWWVDMHNAVFSHPTYGNSHTAVANNASYMMDVFAKLFAICAACEPEPVPENKPKDYVDLSATWRDDCRARYGELESAFNAYLSVNSTQSNEYVIAAEALRSVSNECYLLVRSDCQTESSKVEVNGQRMTVDAAIQAIWNDLYNLHSAYTVLIGLLNIAIDGDIEDGGKTKSLDALLALTETYVTEFEDYDNAADNSSTNLGEQERTEISQKELEQNITKESVQELKTRLENIRDQYTTLRSEIETLTYGGVCLKDIRNFATFKNCALTVVQDGQISLKQSEIDSYSNQTLGQLLKPADADMVKLENLDNDDYNPDLKVKTPALYTYMKNKFSMLDLKKMEEKKKEEEDVTKEGGEQDQFQEKQKDELTKYRGNVDATMAALGNEFGLGDFFGSVLGLVSDIFTGNFDGIRDDMYVTTYAMEMFSHAVYDREAMYNLLDEKDNGEELKKNMGPKNPDTYYKDTCGVYGESADSRKTWLSSDYEDTYNKTLTNKMINHGNNHIYLAEIEYLIYGKASPQDNIKAAYGNIYATRYVVNLISGFQHFWTGGNATANTLIMTSQTLSSFTGFVVPYQVFQAVLIPILTAMETCMDNNRLFAGMPVELYKVRPEEWWISFETDTDTGGVGGFFTQIKGFFTGDVKKNQDKGLFYSDYLTIFLYCALTSGSTEESVYKRIGALIEKNIDKVSGEEGFKLANTQMYFQIDATIRVKPLMVTLPYVQQYGTSMETTTDWCTYKVHMVRGYS